MTEFVKGKVFTIAEVRENKDGQILAKVVASTPELSSFIESFFVKFYQVVKFYRVAQVDGLIEGYQYSFRVKAVNLGSTVNYCMITLDLLFFAEIVENKFCKSIFCRGCGTSLPPPYHQKL